MEAVARARDARVLLLASDAADNTAPPGAALCRSRAVSVAADPLYQSTNWGRPLGRGFRRRGRYYGHRPCQSPWSAAWRSWTRCNMTKQLARLDAERPSEQQREKPSSRPARKEPASGHQAPQKAGSARMRKRSNPQDVSSKPSGEKQRRSAGVLRQARRKGRSSAEPPKTAERQNSLPRMTAPAGPSAKADPALPKATAPNPRGGRIHTPTAAR